MAVLRDLHACSMQDNKVYQACRGVLLATLAHSGVRGSVFWPSDSSCITSRARDERTILH